MPHPAACPPVAERIPLCRQWVGGHSDPHCPHWVPPHGGRRSFFTSLSRNAFGCSIGCPYCLTDPKHPANNGSIPVKEITGNPPHADKAGFR
eukprot:gene461-biopygen34655